MNKNIDFKNILSIAKENRCIQVYGGKTYCPVCGAPLFTFWNLDKECIGWKNPTQKAHLLSNDKKNNKKYGKIIIEDPLNHMLVCSLRCNNDIQIRNNPVEEQKILINVIYYNAHKELEDLEYQKLYSAWNNMSDLLIEDLEYKDKYQYIASFFRKQTIVDS